MTVLTGNEQGMKMAGRNDRGTGRPDTKMSQWDDKEKRARFGVGTKLHQRVQAKANTRRRQRDKVVPTDFEDR